MQFDAMSKWGGTLGTFQPYSAASASGAWNPTLRASDVLSLGQSAFAAGIIAHITANPAAAGELASNALLIALNGHSTANLAMDTHGYTAETQNPAKRSHSICALAGAAGQTHRHPGWNLGERRCHCCDGPGLPPIWLAISSLILSQPCIAIMYYYHHYSAININHGRY